MENFTQLGLPQSLLDTINAIGYTQPTPIQAQAIPVAIQGSDILGSAQTGTGKTGAFSIPMIVHVTTNPTAAALVLTPTRELAAQVQVEVQKLLGAHNAIKTALLIGGDSMGKQLKQLQAKPRIVIGTPGRVNDHLKRGTLRLQHSDFLVLDETDRMLDMGFGIQIDKIIHHLPKERQTLLFSATLPAAIITLSKKYLRNPQRIAVGSTNTPIAAIEQSVLQVGDGEKYATLNAQLEKNPGSVIVFVKTKHGADRLAKNLKRDGHEVAALHGDLQQRRRTRVIEEFRQQDHRILVATDVAARGLDIPHIELVINYDMPQVPEDYIHRIGRTARAGAKGKAISFVTRDDNRKWRAIEQLLQPRGHTGTRLTPSASDVMASHAPRTAKAPLPRRDKPAFNRDAAPRGDKPRQRDGDKPAWRGERRDGGKPSFRGGKPWDNRRPDAAGDGARPFRPRADDPQRQRDGDKPAFRGDTRRDGGKPSFRGGKPWDNRRPDAGGDGARPFRPRDGSGAPRRAGGAAAGKPARAGGGFARGGKPRRSSGY